MAKHSEKGEADGDNECDGDIGKEMEMRRKMERWRGCSLSYVM
jgi:hypothetical protein